MGRRGKGEGTVRHRSDGRWEGRKNGETYYAKTKKELLAKMADPTPERKENEQVVMLSCAYINTWLIAKETSGVANKTLYRLKQICNTYLIPQLGHIPLVELATTHVRIMDGELATKKVSDWERWRIGDTLKAILKSAVEEKLLPKYPLEGYKSTKKPTSKSRFLTRDEVSKLLAIVEGENYSALVYLLLDSGIRPGEAFALERTDFDPDKRTIKVDKTLENINGYLKVKIPKTKGSNRTILLTTQTVDKLTKHCQETPGRKLLFGDSEGGHIRESNFRLKVWLKWTKKMDVGRIRLYDLRHTCASLLLLSGVHLKIVSERLGHSDVATTLKVYSHVLPSMQERAVEVMVDILSGQKSGQKGEE